MEKSAARTMYKIGWVVVVVSCLISGSDSAAEGCGDETTNNCPPGLYCDIFSHYTDCKSCSDICEKTKNNYNPDQCNKQCKGRDPERPDTDHVYFLNAKIEKIETVATVALSLVCVLVVVLGVVAVLKIRNWKNANNVTLKNLHKKIFPKSTNNATGHSNGTAMNDQGSGKPPDLRLEIPSPGALSENSPVTMTTAVSRMPAEDSIDYAYDNPVMSNSSSPSRLGHVPT